jgi:hypothetical protein
LRLIQVVKRRPCDFASDFVIKGEGQLRPKCWIQSEKVGLLGLVTDVFGKDEVFLFAQQIVDWFSENLAQGASAMQEKVCARQRNRNLET